MNEAAAPGGQTGAERIRWAPRSLDPSLLRESPAFAVYLAALLLLPFRWLSPLGHVQEHGTWTDVLVAVAGALWLIERITTGSVRRSVRAWQLPLLAYLLLSCVSAAAVHTPRSGGRWTTVLVMAELAVLAVISADFAADAARRRLIAGTILLSSMLTVILAVVGESLFYLGDRTGLVGSYGAMAPSHLYARVQAGLESPPLLGSYCIFASGMVASREGGLGRRARLASQLLLGVLCLATLSRAVFGFVLAAVLRASPRLPHRWRKVVPAAVAAASVAAIAALTVGQLRGNPARPSSFSYVIPAPHDRRQTFTTSLATLERHPWLGIGPGALPGHNHRAATRAHFTPLNIAATLGLPALGALVAMLAMVWRRRRRPTDVALWSAFAGIALDGLANDVDHYRHVWILLGLLGSDTDTTRVQAGDSLYRSPPPDAGVKGWTSNTHTKSTSVAFTPSSPIGSATVPKRKT